ncbi:amylo-alpha-1,6-glucosidase [Pseudoroseomonas sp. WGS1072]|uniref:amylo-alpha-1,6-glucosidase n=1 Tax=Roseomonas sp. WGS1072 TaxID=3366816 RepID=UPI003BF0A1E9
MDGHATEAGPPDLSAFPVSATVSLQEGHLITLKHGDSFALFDHAGDLGPGAQGFYHGDTRYLSLYTLLLNGARPMLLSAALQDDNAALACDLTNPDLPAASGEAAGLPNDRIHLRRSRFLWDSTCHERISVRNFDDRRRHVTIELYFDSDFADLFEARGAERLRHGTRHAAETGPAEVRLAYTGLDSVRRETRLRFDPTPEHLESHRAVFRFDLLPGERRAFFVEIGCDRPTAACPPQTAFGQALRHSRRALRMVQARRTRVETSNDIFNETLHRAGADLSMLTTDKPEGPYPYAGIPWYSTAFGRDALIAAWHTLWYDPALARGVLGYLAAHQATETDPLTDAEPGKILHETRQGEMAMLGEVPFRRYYGSVDSTPLFIMLAGAYLDRTGDIAHLRRLWPNIEAALGWIEESGDPDGDGFVEYQRKRPDGLLNQGWKDSHDSIFHASGEMAEGPIALVEMQAYVYAAWRAAAGIARQLGQATRAAALEERAARLQRDFDTAFWDEALGTYVLALDGRKRPCRVRASNAGHALFAGIALPHRAERVAQAMMEPAFFSGWGIRTLAAGQPRYNPMSYHNGSVWPHDNALIAEGFVRYGQTAAAIRIFEGLFAAATYVDLRRLPELFCGFPRRRGQGPTLYPVACSPQAWAATTPLALLGTCLGLSFDPVAGCIRFEKPALPRFLDGLTLRNLRLGKGHLDIGFGRAGGTFAHPAGEVAIQVLSRSNGLRAELRA